MSIYQELSQLIKKSAQQDAVRKAVFFKTGKGQYAEHDQFIGVSVPTLRRIAKSYKSLPLMDITHLLHSPFNEERLLALILLTKQYKQGDLLTKENLYVFYKNNLKHVNNWNLVDASAHLIMGAHLIDKEKDILLELGQSSLLWERRIAMVATWYFIRHNQCEWTFKLAKMLMQDSHDLMHKAVGWMLREAGKKSPSLLLDFLDHHTLYMPRTMLRYAIEKLPESQRKAYLIKGKINGS